MRCTAWSTVVRGVVTLAAGSFFWWLLFTWRCGWRNTRCLPQISFRRVSVNVSVTCLEIFSRKSGEMHIVTFSRGPRFH